MMTVINDDDSDDEENTSDTSADSLGWWVCDEMTPEPWFQVPTHTLSCPITMIKELI